MLSAAMLTCVNRQEKKREGTKTEIKLNAAVK